MRTVIVIYCKIVDWANDVSNCFDFIFDYDPVPPDCFIVGVLSKEQGELLVPPEEETLTPEQFDNFSAIVSEARKVLSEN